ncbi:succinyldiaminopimelate transaminase [Yinghuangia seranimata]|uniref:succinyldiaminopimelate transaminase n=1 Tax=Yinghuangia seranimata TaxID=408067 RepID=UPI00248AC572|nr:succinyldiaminopimelate transaminase [Yinghuangia seranimata]MDI2128935.1 succinyldiaminopimelate transaminase [Yinghuangia seranimata]
MPEFPWDRLEVFKATAAEHPDGIVDLSVGTPVDPTPRLVQDALVAAADSPGYPLTYGTPALREAVADWLRRRLGVTGADPAAVLPLIGTKELVAGLPALLGLGPGDKVLHPALAYPTYDVGARLAGAEPVPVAAGETPDPEGVRLVWLNSPGNPHGAVSTVEELREVVAWARGIGALVVSDECYIELGWDAEPVSVLHPDVCGGSHEGLLALHSLSKRSNLAGYRAGFVTGDPAVVKELLAVRKHAGMIVPGPVQEAMRVAFGDDEHVAEQKARYGARRAQLRGALESAGFRIDHSEASLYLWATRDEPCWDTVAWLAERGVLVAPGDFYGVAGERHVRVAFTATDERVEAAVERLKSA